MGVLLTLRTIEVTPLLYLIKPNRIQWHSPCSFYGLLGGIFHFYSIFIEKSVSKSRNPDQTLQNDQTPRSAASDLDLHRFPISNKKER